MRVVVRQGFYCSDNSKNSYKNVKVPNQFHSFEYLTIIGECTKFYENFKSDLKQNILNKNCMFYSRLLQIPVNRQTSFKKLENDGLLEFILLYG